MNVCTYVCVHVRMWYAEMKLSRQKRKRGAQCVCVLSEFNIHTVVSSRIGTVHTYVRMYTQSLKLAIC